MSRQAWESIVRSSEEWDGESMYEDRVCLHVVSKLLRGESAVRQEEKQECPDSECVTLKRFGEYRMEIESGPCDSELSREMLNGQAEGRLVSAYADADTGQRGGMSGDIRWQGSGADIVGRTIAVLNAGTHHDPLKECEECHQPGHAEGWLRAAVIEGECAGARVNGAVSYEFRISEGGAEFIGTLEGLLIVQCAD